MSSESPAAGEPAADNWPAKQPGLSLTEPTGVRWWMFGLACSTSFLLYLHRYTLGMLKPEFTREFGWTAEQLGWLDSAFMICYSIGQIPGGMLGDWFGPRLVLSLMILLWSLALGGMTLAGGFASMAGVRGLFGFAQAGCYPNLSKVTKVWFPLTERTAVQGWVSSFSGRMGGAVSNVLFGTVMLGMWHLSWRAALGIFTGLGLLFTGVFLILFRNSPRQHPWSNTLEADLVTAGDPSAVAVARSRINWGPVFRSWNVRMLLLQQFCAAYVDNLFPLWIPSFLLQQKLVDMKSAGWMSALPILGGALGGMIGGGMLQNWLIVRTGKRRWSRSLVGFTGCLCATVMMFVSLSFDSAVAISWAFFVLKFFADWSQPTTWGAVTDIAGRNSASLFALVNTAGSFAGFVAGPVMGLTIGYFGGDATTKVATAAGWDALFVSIGVMYLLSAVAWLFIDCTKPLDGQGM